MMRILGPLPPAARSHLGAAINPAAPAQAAQPDKKRRLLIPWAAHPTGSSPRLRIDFISFSFPPNLSFFPRRIYIQAAGHVNQPLFFGHHRKDYVGGMIFIVVDPQVGLFELCRPSQIVSRLEVPVVLGPAPCGASYKLL
jgi:hypothetical protein